MSKLDLPIRLIDFFFECGLKPDVALVEQSILNIPDEEDKPRGQSEASHSPPPAASSETSDIKASTEIRITTINEDGDVPEEGAAETPESPTDEKTEGGNGQGKVVRESLQRRAALRGSRYSRMSGIFNPEDFDAPKSPESGQFEPLYVPPRRTSMDARRMSRSSRRGSANPTSPIMDKNPAYVLQSGSEFHKKIANGGHPLHWSYEPQTICRYPKEDYSDCKFPDFMSIFCYPNNLKFAYDDNGRPSERFHSFIVTEETGARLHGVTVTVYEPLPQALASQLETLTNTWKDLRFKSGDLEYILSLQAQLSKYQEILVHAKMGMVPESDGSSNAYGTVKLEDRKALRNAEDMVKHYSELLKPLSDLLVDCDNVYYPRSYGLVSHWPFYDFMKDWLLVMIKSTRDDPGVFKSDAYIPLERLVVNITQEIPLPPPGKLEICLSVRQFNLYCSRPPINRIPLVKNFSFYPFFKCLSIENIINIFESVLNERKIIILSSHLSMLNLVAETVCTIFFPFSWQHVYIPVLPERLLSYLQAPMPYIIGVQRDYFGAKQQNEWKPNDAVVIDLDYNIITSEMENIKIPSKDRKKLTQRLESAIGLIQNSANPNARIRRFERGIPISSQYALPYEKFAPHCHESALHKYAAIPMVSPHISRQNSKTESSESKKGPRDSSASVAPTPLGSSQLSGVSTSSLESFSSGWYPPTPGTDAAKSFKDRRQSTVSVATFNSRGPKLFHRGGQHASQASFEFSDRESISGGGNGRSGNSYGLFKKSRHAASGSLQAPTSPNSVFDPSSEGGMLSSITRDGHHFIQMSFSNSDTQSVIMESTSPESSNANLKAGSAGSSGDDYPPSSMSGMGGNGPSSGTLRSMTMKKISFLKGKSFNNHRNLGAAGMSSHSIHASDIDGPGLTRSPSVTSKMASNSSLNLQTPSFAITQSHNISEIKAKDCSICYNALSTEGQGGIYKCNDCNFVIHGNCLTITDSRPCPALFRENRIQDAFVSFFVGLIKNYRQFLIPFDKRKSALIEGGGGISDMPLQEEWFKMTEFLNSYEKDSRPFMQMLSDTQAFAQFTLERAERPDTDYEVLLFDEFIKIKKNRSKLKITKSDTPFLNDTRNDISSTVFTMSPNTEGITMTSTAVGTSGKGTHAIPCELDASLMVKARQFEPLVTDAEHRQMRSMANEIIQRARLATSSKRKQDISKWMKTKLKARVGGADGVLLGYLTDEQRKDLFDERLALVSQVLDQCEFNPIEDLSLYEVEEALKILHEQNMTLMKATDEEQLVDVNEQDDLQTIYTRLFRVITLYEDRKDKLRDILDQLGSDQDLKSESEAPHTRGANSNSSSVSGKAGKRDGIVLPLNRNHLVLPTIDAHSSFDNLVTSDFVTTSQNVSTEQDLAPRTSGAADEQVNEAIAKADKSSEPLPAVAQEPEEVEEEIPEIPDTIAEHSVLEAV